MRRSLLRRLGPVAVVLVVVAGLAGGCTEAGGGGPDAGATSTPGGARDGAPGPDAAGPVAEEVADVDALYEVPDPLPAGEHGDLVRYQVATDSVVDGATTHRVMYLSESLAGDPIVVTGLVVVPDGAPPEGGRPVLTIAHGTTGVADACAPSRSGSAEIAVAAAAVERGWVLALTDYEGLGTPGVHPYLVGESEGRGVLDAARAAAQVPGADTNATTMIAGYSQGGHGALWANQVAAEWTPELDVVGTFAGAPASEIPVILAAAASPGVAGFALLIVAGFAAAYPDADPAAVLTPAGLDALAAAEQGCADDAFDAAAAAGGPVFVADAATVEPWAELAAANDPGHVATDDPVLMIHSDDDTVVPPSFSEVLLERMCAAGQAAERRVIADGGGHGPAAVVAYPEAVAWFDRILAGDTVPDTCP